MCVCGGGGGGGGGGGQAGRQAGRQIETKREIIRQNVCAEVKNLPQQACIGFADFKLNIFYRGSIILITDYTILSIILITD